MAWILCASVLAASSVHEPIAQLMSVTDAPSLGSKLAKVVIVEYSDFHCPFCRRHARDVLPRLKRDYVETGHARYVYRNAAFAGPAAADVAVAAMCAARQGKFWEIHDRFFGGSRPVAPRDVESHARALKLNVAPFRACLKGIAGEDVRVETEEARRLGFRGTPGFAIGLREDDERMRIMHRIGGAQSYDVFKRVLDELIARD
jgi:protein-disulfide isomerase